MPDDIDEEEISKVRTETIENGASAGLRLAHLAAKAAEGKILAEDLVEIGKRKAQRMVRRGRCSAGVVRDRVNRKSAFRGRASLLRLRDKTANRLPGA